MEEEKGKREMAGTDAPGNPDTVDSRRGPGWKGWVLSILVAVILSVTATLLLGGYGAFRSDRAGASGAAGSGCGGGCCPPAATGK
jgi:hypothetical protein